MAQGWKRVLEWTAVRSGLSALERRRRTPSGVILSYHNVVPRGEPLVGDRSLHVDQAVFAAQLDLLGETHEIVTLEELVANRSAAPGVARAAVTFDDAYLGAMTVGLDELARRNMPSTVFVAPGILGTPGCWWDLLADGDGALAPGLRRHALEELGGRHASVMAWAGEQALPTADLPAHARPTSAEELVRQADRPGVSLGAHTWAHVNLAAVSPLECTEEMTRSRTWLQNGVGRFCDWLAYPYGLWNERVAERAAEVFAGALRVDGGLALARGRARGPVFATPRVNVPRGLTLDGLRLRLAGLR